MGEKPTRREAIQTLAAGALVQLPAPYRPQSFSESQFRLVSILVDHIIPPSDTPGAAAAGVDRYIDQELAARSEQKTRFLAGLALLERDGFGALSPSQQIELLTRYSADPGQAGEFFRLLKDLTVDGYYGSEIGLVRELGYRGNAFLREFPGCTHPEHR